MSPARTTPLRLRHRFLACAASSVLVAAAAACSSDPSGAGGYFVFITNSWEDVAQAGHTFNLVADNGEDGGTEGTFTGDEQIDGNLVAELTGSWADDRVTFTVQRAAGNVTYTANLTANDASQLAFTSSAGNLTIRKQ